MNALRLRSRLTRSGAAGALFALKCLVIVAAFLCAMALPALVLGGCPLESDPDPECACVGEIVHGCPCTAATASASASPSAEPGK